MTKIALLCPTRGRPEQFKRMCESVDKTSTVENIIMAGLFKDDIHADEYGFSEHFRQSMLPDWSTVMSWNHLANLALETFQDAKLFMLAADDIIFETAGWDKALINHYEALENKIHVYALQDSRDPDGTPHFFATREYVEAMGYFVPPIFLHWFVDTWTVAIAKANGVFTHLRDYRLEHRKPSDHGSADETHSRIRRMGWHERDRYVNEMCGHFLAVEKARLRCALGGTKLSAGAYSL